MTQAEHAEGRRVEPCDRGDKQMKRKYDVVILGTGNAGMAAADTPLDSAFEAAKWAA